MILDRISWVAHSQVVRAAANAACLHSYEPSNTTRLCEAARDRLRVCVAFILTVGRKNGAIELTKYDLEVMGKGQQGRYYAVSSWILATTKEAKASCALTVAGALCVADDPTS